MKGCQEYGQIEYWDDRYEASGDSGFDWLFCYADVKQYLDAIFSHRGKECKTNEKFLLTGAGNAPFSYDLYSDGYKNIVNIDNSCVVIDQMKEKHPELEWVVMDALCMSYADETFENVIDKSLIDTILCYPNSTECVAKQMSEAYRVLKPGGYLLSFSLHPWHEIKSSFYDDNLDWIVMPYNIPNARWNSGENVQRSVVHTMVVCIKRDRSSRCDGNNEDFVPFDIPNTLTDQEVQNRTAYAKELIDEKLYARVNVNVLQKCLASALDTYELATFHAPTKYDEDLLSIDDWESIATNSID